MFLGAIDVAPRRARYFETQKNMLKLLPGLLRDGDTILVKASRGMHLEKTVEVLKAL
jgi:UDP-N-acetylmuramoyl-tripeptide--D-alanyl-D-alanine ligase